MGKITIMLNNETENKIRDYIAEKYPRKTFGKISEVIETAINEYLQRQE